MDHSYLAGLNDRQRQAVRFGLGAGSSVPGPLLVVAGAGTGKTNTLAHRVAHTVITGGDPARILLMTFSRRAATEMASRVKRLVSKALSFNADPSFEWHGTFHSIGAKLLREYAGSIGINPSFSIHDTTDSADLIDLVRHDLEFSSLGARFPQKGTCLAIYSKVVNTRQELGDVLLEHYPWCIQWTEELRHLFAAYVAAKHAQNVLDFDDLLLYWALMMKVPELATDISEKFDYVFVDEYQDSNSMQAEILLSLKPDGRGIMVVGDDAQAIYRFRGAEIANILNFPMQFIPNAKVITLDQSYRSARPILNAANAVIALAEKRYTKDLWSTREIGDKPVLVSVRDEGAQAQYVAEKLLQNREVGERLQDQVVLFRASHHSGQLELELTRRNIPYVKHGGMKLLEATHIKDLINILRWAENLKDKVSAFRILKLLPGMGPSRAGKLIDVIMGSIHPTAVLRAFVPPVATQDSWHTFLELMERLRAPMLTWPADVSLAREWYRPILEQNHDDFVARSADMEQLEQIASTYATRQRFISDFTLDPVDASKGRSDGVQHDDDYVVLSTVHSAKGLEFSRVFILNCVTGAFPSDLAAGKESIEEERRLFYVAMTRAKNSLELLQPMSFHARKQRAQGDRHVLASRTPFIPDEILGFFERAAWPDTIDTEARSPKSTIKIDLEQDAKSMWERRVTRR